MYNIAIECMSSPLSPLNAISAGRIIHFVNLRIQPKCRLSDFGFKFEWELREMRMSRWIDGWMDGWAVKTTPQRPHNVLCVIFALWPRPTAAFLSQLSGPVNGSSHLPGIFISFSLAFLGSHCRKGRAIMQTSESEGRGLEL